MKKQLDIPEKYQKQYELLLDKFNLLIWRIGLPQVDIAPLINISQNSLSRMLANNQGMPIEVVANLAEVLRLPWSCLSPKIGRDTFVSKYGDRTLCVDVSIAGNRYATVLGNIRLSIASSMLTQKEIAEILDVRQASVSRMISGEQEIATKTILQLLDITSSSLDSLNPY